MENKTRLVYVQCENARRYIMVVLVSSYFCRKVSFQLVGKKFSTAKEIFMVLSNRIKHFLCFIRLEGSRRLGGIGFLSLLG